MAVRRAYAGGAVPTTLASPITNVATSATLVSLTGYPSGSSKWYAVIDRGEPTEEKVLVTQVAAFVVTITRGQDGTTAQAHSGGATFEHCITATDADEANAHVVATGSEHGLPVGASFVGTTGAQTLEDKTLDFNPAGGANIATNIPTSASPLIMAEITALDAALDAEIATRSTQTADRYTKAETDAGFVNTAGDTMTGPLSLSAATPVSALHAAPKAYVDAQVPIGAISMYGGSAAPTNWLLCDGQAVSRTTYATLFALLGIEYGAGNGTSTFNVPNLGAKVPRGTGGGVDRGDTGGATTHVIAEANLPPHQHATDHNHASFNTAEAGSHTHDANFNDADGAGSPNPAVIDVGATSGAYGATISGTGGTGAHLHAIDVPAFVGTSGNGPGSATPLDTMDPWLGVTFIIRAL